MQTTDHPTAAINVQFKAPRYVAVEVETKACGRTLPMHIGNQVSID